MRKNTSTQHLYAKFFHQKVIKCFINYIPINEIPYNLNEEDIDLVIDEIVNNEDFDQSDTAIETYESIEELNYHQEYEDQE